MFISNDPFVSIPIDAVVKNATRIIVGAGCTSQPGWLSLEQDQLNITNAADWAKLFRKGSLEAILAEHVFEHLTEAEARQAARLAFEYLRPGGYLRIAVPDGFHPDPTYINWVRPGGVWNPRDHKQLYTHESLTEQLQAAGFTVRLWEFWDRGGWFHSKPFRKEDGDISRCLWGITSSITSAFVGCRYTSLLVDAIKPRAG